MSKKKGKKKARMRIKTAKKKEIVETLEINYILSILSFNMNGRMIACVKIVTPIV